MLESVVVKRPPQDPPELARLARATKTEPRDLLVTVIGKHPTFDGAAGELGVSLVTLRRWRRRYGIEVE